MNLRTLTLGKYDTHAESTHSIEDFDDPFDSLTNDLEHVIDYEHKSIDKRSQIVSLLKFIGSAKTKETMISDMKDVVWFNCFLSTKR